MTDKILITIIICILIAILVFSVISIVFVCKKDKKEILQTDLWNMFIANADKFKYDGWCHFRDKEVSNTFFYGGYQIVLWCKEEKLPVASVHIKDGNECVLSSYNMEKSREMAEILLTKVGERFSSTPEFILNYQVTH